MSPQSDILVEIPDAELPLLASLYKKNALWAPYMISFIGMVIKWKKSEKYRSAITVTSPSKTWQANGTIIAIMTCHCYDLFIFTLDDNEIPILYKALSQTKIIDFSKRVQFFGIHEKYFHIVDKIIEEKKLNIWYQIPSCYFMGLSTQKCRELTWDCPLDVCIKKLEVSAAKQITDVYPHKFEGVEEYVASLIEINGGYGVFVKATEELAAWVVKHSFGHVGYLQTEEKHKRKGYGGLLTKVLSKELGEEGHWSTATVVTHNPAAVGMFETLGFVVLNNTVFTRVEPTSS